MSDKRQARDDCQRPFSIETLRKRVLLESTASENAEASSGETVMPVGADMVGVAERAEARLRDWDECAGDALRQPCPGLVAPRLGFRPIPPPTPLLSSLNVGAGRPCPSCLL